MLTLSASTSQIPRVTPKYAKALKKLGITTAKDLLFHFPFRYDDYSQISPISLISPNQTVTVEGEITDSRTTRTWKRRMYLTEIKLQDKTGFIKAVWFNQPYLAEQLVLGKKIRISGKVSGARGSASLPRRPASQRGEQAGSDQNDQKKPSLFKKTVKGEGLYFSNPAWELAKRTPTNTGRLVPVYPETEGVSSRWLRWQIQNLLKFSSSFLFSLSDPIPPLILKKLNLPPLQKAIRWIHFPDTMNHAIVAQKRFAFEEMFLVQLKSLQIRSAWQKEKAVKIKFDEKLIKNFVNKLPFKLTNAQRKSSFEILRDLEKNRPMNRLLNGDVGSGKTIVAAIASLQTVTAGYQTAIMAPTEVLARQHFENFCKMFKNYNFNIALLTNSYKITCHCEHSPACRRGREAIPSKKMQLGIAAVATLHRNDILKKIKSGQINLIIGTHALIQEDVKFKNLALVIVDEQHRFGVMQRAALQQAALTDTDLTLKQVPHLLTMTATPIPRTLALAFFGNLDISVLDEMPAERKKIITEIVAPQGKNKIYNFIRKEIKNGRQVFVILPLVEESKILTEVKAATKEYERLSQEIFPDLKLGLIHGRLKPAEKEKAMKDFTECKTDILVATPVVEVGIDIPNATVMIIEDADRFGLSQLHQFRGRIGRGVHQSYCFLFSSSNSSSAKSRLKALVESENGFKIAEKDLELRGPGEFLGTRQSGLPDIAMENLANIKLIQIAREEAQELLKSDPELKKYPALKDALQKFGQEVHLE